MSLEKREEISKKEIFEIEHLLNGRYFNRSAAIAKVNHLIHLFPENSQIMEKYDLSYDFPVIYKKNGDLKNLLIEFRILIEESASK